MISSKEMCYFVFLQVSLMPNSIWDSSIVVSVSAFYPLLYILFLKYLKAGYPHRDAELEEHYQGLHMIFKLRFETSGIMSAKKSSWNKSVIWRFNKDGDDIMNITYQISSTKSFKYY